MEFQKFVKPLDASLETWRATQAKKKEESARRKKDKQQENNKKVRGNEASFSWLIYIVGTM